MQKTLKYMYNIFIRGVCRKFSDEPSNLGRAFSLPKTNESSSLCPSYTNEAVSVDAYFRSGSLVSWYVLDQPPMKTPGTEFLMSFSGKKTFHLCCHSWLMEELSTSFVTQLGEDSWELVLSFLLALSQAPFLSTDFYNIFL